MLETAGLPSRVLIANVGGREIGASCAGAIRTRWGVEVEFVLATAYAAGVSNAYREPEKLGVDRWLAIIAAHASAPGASCVVSVGTAMTVDGVDANGTHLGGVIVPGPQLMVSSLLKNTSDIAARMSEPEVSCEVFANHTNAAVLQGCAQALAGLVDRAASEMERKLGTRPKLLLTGGASEVIAPLIGPHEAVADLVLRGLAVLAQGEIAQR
jgi:type III pantothenate kinase